ncbi:hypothetical protein Agub_g6802, partial [Astrephomene gubernaculifera]
TGKKPPTARRSRGGAAGAAAAAAAGGGAEGVAVKQEEEEGGAEQAAPRDFSGTDPELFRQYDTRPDPEEGGASLDKAGPGMIVKRWQALLSSLPASSLRTYAPGERMGGCELSSYDQAYGEFIHLYGSKLPAGAAKRILVEAKRRVRLLVRTPPTAACTPAATHKTSAAQDDNNTAAATAPASHPSGRAARAAALRAVAASREHLTRGSFRDGSSEEEE